MEATSNSPILAVIIFTGLTVGDESQKLGGQEVFVGGGISQTTVASMEVRLSGGEVGRSGRNCCHCIGLVRIWVKMRSYKIVIPTKPRGSRTLLVAVAEAKMGVWQKIVREVK